MTSSSGEPGDDVRRACETYAFHGQLGLERVDFSYCSAVRDLQNPDVWSSNKAFSVVAASSDEIEAVMREVDVAFSALSYRHFVIDPYTPSAFTAQLALQDYSEHATTLQMVLDGPLNFASASPGVELRPVETDEDWAVLRDLVLKDHAEGARTQAKKLSETITDGVVAGYRAKEGPCQFFIGEFGNQPCAYGAGIISPNGMGMVEDLFTLPEFRGRGFASTVIAHCVDYCRARGADQILIGSHANEAPKHLYRKLGFEPVCLTREYIKNAPRLNVM